MKVLRGIQSIDPPLARSVLTIGNFDGVHRGHQQLLTQAGLFAANTGGPVVVLTFDPHPLSVVAPSRAPARLSREADKLQLLADAGADVAVIADSRSGILDLEADRFVDEVLRARFHPTHIVEGPSFGFGKGREGTPDRLRVLAGRFGCEVHTVEPVRVHIDQGETLQVSSSMIRGLLLEGKVRRAALCLGRPYDVLGEVVHGMARGRTLGFPTANLTVADQLVPGDGVYACRAVLGESEVCPAAVSIGSCPTFGDVHRQVEAFLLDFDGDLYDQQIRLAFMRLLRPQEKYVSADALQAQMARDVEAVRDCLHTRCDGEETV